MDSEQVLIKDKILELKRELRAMEAKEYPEIVESKIGNIEVAMSEDGSKYESCVDSETVDPTKMKNAYVDLKSVEVVTSSPDNFMKITKKIEMQNGSCVDFYDSAVAVSKDITVVTTGTLLSIASVDIDVVKNDPVEKEVVRKITLGEQFFLKE